MILWPAFEPGEGENPVNHKLKAVTENRIKLEAPRRETVTTDTSGGFRQEPEDGLFQAINERGKRSTQLVTQRSKKHATASRRLLGRANLIHSSFPPKGGCAVLYFHASIEGARNPIIWTIID
jgi:hypothetical protein